MYREINVFLDIFLLAAYNQHTLYKTLYRRSESYFFLQFYGYFKGDNDLWTKVKTTFTSYFTIR